MPSRVLWAHLMQYFFCHFFCLSSLRCRVCVNIISVNLNKWWIIEGHYRFSMYTMWNFSGIKEAGLKPFPWGFHHIECQVLNWVFIQTLLLDANRYIWILKSTLRAFRIPTLIINDAISIVRNNPFVCLYFYSLRLPPPPQPVMC